MMAKNAKEYPPTPRVQCHTRADADILEKILKAIEKGNKMTSIIKMGAVVYVHMEDENI